MLIVGIDTYITASEATEMLCGTAYFENWTALSVEQQESALKLAAMQIDLLPLNGTKTSQSQMMEFPRKPYNYIPQSVKMAQVYEAVESTNAEKSERLELQAQGITSITLGGVSESYNGKGSTNNYGFKSITAYKLMRRYICGSAVIT